MIWGALTAPLKEGDKYMTAPDNRDLTKPKVAPFSNSWRTGADKKGSITMNEKTTALIHAIAAATAAERDFKAVNAAASATIAEPDKGITDKIPAERVEEITHKASELLHDAHSIVVWVSNGVECACASSVSHPNVGSRSVSWVIGPAKLDEISAEFLVKRLADDGALGLVDDETECDIFNDEFEEAKEDNPAADADDKRAVCPLGKDYEVAIAKFISGYLSKPQTIRDILDGKETADSSIKKAVDIFNN